ncbi:hypothetical protein VTN31DRAFT_846 [Thermomyces dupontii]|uniref:uncharacterized protein n=1 Tax=Talaromyces thermophilus TaxID=28565 RepID=UPI0037421721
MISIVVIVFLVNLAIYLINTIGANTIDTLLWILYLRLPTSLSKDARKHRELKREVIRLRTEMNSTSSQDEFAKWAKLRRRHDKTLEEFEALNRAIGAKRSSFDWTIRTTRWLSTTGVRLLLQMYYSKTPMFDLPQGWFPYPIEFVLSMPRAPLGTVSIQVWGFACGKVISLVGDAVINAGNKGQKTSKKAQGTGTEKKEL